MEAASSKQDQLNNASLLFPRISSHGRLMKRAKRPGDACRGGGEPDHEGLQADVGAAGMAPNKEDSEAHLVGGAKIVGLGEEGDAELREKRPHAAPAPSNETGPDGVGRAEVAEDLGRMSSESAPTKSSPTATSVVAESGSDEVFARFPAARGCA
uniref:Uncharacterized protein n=1 Tax=Setaria viridis TaxID=4556 RepID=A0A4U6TH24_SETVI|nr:hypothetical protein SEVIR_8G192800v2 [Setaria viridis]